MTKKRWIALIVFLAIMLLSAVTQLGTASLRAGDKDWSEEIYQQGGLEQIALLEVEGVITNANQVGGFFSSPLYNHEVFLKQLKEAFQNEQIKAILLHVNSPGGGVVESDEIYHTIRKLKAEYEKPLVVYMSNTAASGGYYISALADTIYANRSTITGSIGVIISSLNYRELAEEWGVKDQTFTSGPHKDIMSPMKEMTAKEREIIQSIVDELYANFVDVIVEGRKMSREDVLQIADGRIYTGSQAKELGLVDEIGFLDEAIEGTAALANLDHPTVIRYKQSSWGNFGFMGKTDNHSTTFMYLLPW